MDEYKINSIIKNEEIISQMINLFTHDDKYIKTKIISNDLIENIKTILNSYNYTLNAEEIELLINSIHQAIEYVGGNPNKGTLSPVDENQLLNVAGGVLDPQTTMLLIQLAVTYVPKAFRAIKNSIKNSVNSSEKTQADTKIQYDQLNPKI